MTDLWRGKNGWRENTRCIVQRHDLMCSSNSSRNMNNQCASKLSGTRKLNIPFDPSGSQAETTKAAKTALSTWSRIKLCYHCSIVLMELKSGSRSIFFINNVPFLILKTDERAFLLLFYSMIRIRIKKLDIWFCRSRRSKSHGKIDFSSEWLLTIINWK